MSHVHQEKQSPSDVILLVKQFMSDKHLIQALVALPAEKTLPLTGPTSLADRNPLSEKLLSEYRKTASALERRPWSYDKAAQYLRKFCDNNEKADFGDGDPPQMLAFVPKSWVQEQADHEDMLNFAPSPPKPVSIVEAPPGSGRKLKRKRDDRSAATAPTGSANSVPAPADAEAAPGSSSPAVPKAAAKATAKATAKAKAAPAGVPKAKAKAKAKAASVPRRKSLFS